jgi:hypothetical protein
MLAERAPKQASDPIVPESSSIVRLLSRSGTLVREQSARRVDATHEDSNATGIERRPDIGIRYRRFKRNS